MTAWAVEPLQIQRRFKFAQILDKLDFVELSENFALILFDYGQKRLRVANANFKPPCYGRLT